MLPNSVRNIYYKLHQGRGHVRWIADILAWGFMLHVRIFRVKPPYDLTPFIAVSHKHRFMYIGIPKVATRSFRTFFLNHANDMDIEIFEAPRAFQDTLAKYRNYYTFSFVRNPVERILSCYNSKIGHTDLSLLKRARIMSFYKGLTPGMSFEDFCVWLNSDEGLDVHADRHWMSQYRFLYDEKMDKPICDCVGRFENLDNDLNTICEAIGIDFIQLGRDGWVSTKLQSDITQKSIGLIEKRYARDYEVFNYLKKPT